MLRGWKNLSVSKKLFSVVGLMAILIATELLTLVFVMDVLSAVRSFVGAEGNWSKAQKNAVYNLHRYARTQDEQFWSSFCANLDVIKGDRVARVEVEKPVFNRQVLIEGFSRGLNNPEDAMGIVRLIRNFSWISYIHQALKIWTSADGYLTQIEDLGRELHASIQNGRIRPAEIEQVMEQVDKINGNLTAEEVQFSEVLGEGSRWLESGFAKLLLTIVLLVETTGILLTLSFGRSLSRNLKEMIARTRAVGEGDFSNSLQVHSQDELGQLAEAINKMSRDLGTSRDEQAQAKHASDFKSLFVANMSHEIRTPIGVVLGLTEVLKDPLLTSEERKKYIDTIERTGKNILRIINDILDLSKVEAGHLNVETADFALDPFLDELKGLVIFQATRARVDFDIRRIEPLPDQIVTDRNRLRQILLNLAGNAIKYAPGGRVSLSVRAEAAQEKLVFEVEDNGPGISREDQERLFRPFERGQHEDKAEQGGTGLGLALAQGLAEALGGSLQLMRSEPHQGSLFRVEIPLRIGAVEQPLTPARVDYNAKADRETLRGKKVLVVEDSEDNRLLIKLLLTPQGLDIQFAENGAQAVELAAAQEFDLVLMDMQMPVMDGYLATEKLRGQGFKTPIIALTAHAMKEDRDRCLSVGCDYYLTKPIDSNLLFSIMASCVAG